jgi:hypothetical protein
VALALGVFGAASIPPLLGAFNTELSPAPRQRHTELLK